MEARNVDGEIVLTCEFAETPEHRFVWRALASDGATRRQSQATFATLDECAADARRVCLGARCAKANRS